jgi:glycerophosphoryl diester phosphodiesterase
MVQGLACLPALLNRNRTLTLRALIVFSGVFLLAAVSVARAAQAALPEPAVAIRNAGNSVADYLACLRSADVMLVAAHRGGPAPGYPENAIETFAHTLAHGPMLLEVDVRSTRDDAFILMHDDSLDRTTTGSGPVSEADLAAIEALTLVDNEGEATAFRVPTLAHTLAWANGRAILQLDVKPGTPIDAVAREVVASDAQGYAAVIAYSVEDALAAAAVDPALTVSVQLMDVAVLDALAASGLPAQRIMAWTGVEHERTSLWRALNERGVSAAWGSFWYLDEAIRASGDASAFRRLAQGPLDVLSTDLPFLAFDTAATVQGTGAAVTRCGQR